ncbi:major facilitator superfamily domain-containing protein [Zychaea mexicana]|uniref:major facilitator superfamily domain-containing protein n=1 Tax=Zychaea mexicana TaxID=64656 RepID=UPI0022FED86B|nr:major facilitator superfamily domain-containing protein [Zychaea mexicana]KAI9493779.1 major facilitator superfamily domain-containing protein [Zychaea mexicana]
MKTDDSIELSHADLPQSLEELDPKLEAKIRRKYDLRIMPIVTLIYLMAFIDRSNMGNARVLGMEEDLELTGVRFNITLTAFFITYVLFEVPTNIMCKKFGPRIWLSIITCSFGLLTMCIAFCTNFAGITAARAILGIAEAGIMPGISYMLSTFYRRHELVTRVGVYAAFASLAGGFGGLLATGLHMIPPWGMIHTWRNIFFFEGILTIVSGVICYMFLPKSPETARFLTEEERRIGALRIQLEVLTNNQTKIQKSHFKLAIWNLHTILMSIGLFCSLLCMNSIALFMPSLLRTMGYDSIQAQLMTVPPYAVGTVVCIVLCVLSDRFKTRGIIIGGIVAVLITIAFAILLGVSMDSYGVRYMAIFFATAGAFTGSPMQIGWLVENSAGPMVRAITSATGVSIGSLGGLLATWTYATDYTIGHIINLISGVVIICVAVTATINLRWQNRQRALGKKDHILQGLTQDEVEQLGHSHPHFRFTP